MLVTFIDTLKASHFLLVFYIVGTSITGLQLLYLLKKIAMTEDSSLAHCLQNMSGTQDRHTHRTICHEKNF